MVTGTEGAAEGDAVGAVVADTIGVMVEETTGVGATVKG